MSQLLRGAHLGSAAARCNHGCPPCWECDQPHPGGPERRGAPCPGRTGPRSGPPLARRRATALAAPQRSAGSRPPKPGSGLWRAPRPGEASRASPARKRRKAGRRCRRFLLGHIGELGHVRDRVIVLKLARRSLMTTVLATEPPARSPRAVRPESRSSSRGDHERGRPRRRRMSLRRRCSCPGSGAPRGARHDPRTGPTGGRPRRSRGPGGGCRRGVRDVGHGPDSEPAQRHRGPGADAPQHRHRQRVQELEHVVTGNDQQPVGLATRGRELGHELGRGHADRAGQSGSLDHPTTDELGHRPTRPELPLHAAGRRERPRRGTAVRRTG